MNSRLRKNGQKVVININYLFFKFHVITSTMLLEIHELNFKQNLKIFFKQGSKTNVITKI